MADTPKDSAMLRVLVSTALGAIPLADAAVTVSTTADKDGMRSLLYSVRTDQGGMTPPMLLATPPLSNSLAPDSGMPYSLYTVEATKDGYTPLTALQIAMFPGIATVLPIALTPLDENEASSETDLTAVGDPQALYPSATNRKE